jgi:superfamily II DNA/RNA helicase
VQKAAFSILTAGKANNKRANAIIASPTGTGKTLAYLLPLLCTSPGGQFGEGTGGVLIVTPTIELACQIQREVNVLWPPAEEKGGNSACFVVGDGTQNEEVQDDDDSEWTSPGRLILRSITESPIIDGTPKMLRMLYREADYVSRNARLDGDISEEEQTTAKALVSNMRAIVLDEADRLLRTEAVAREAAERKERKFAQRRAEESDDDTPTKKKRLIIARDTQTELLLRDLPIPSLENVQIICASATVGRTMRRQLMQILNVPSADAAATLVTGEDDARVKSKDSEKRRSVLLPEKLEHSYQVVNIESIDEVKDEEMSLAEQNEERMVRATVKSLWDTMASIEAKPILIFPGKIGVERIQQEFIAMGLEDVRTLRNLDGTSPEYPPVEAENPTPWKSVPAYIIGERFARGLDLPNVEYVAMLSPPSSAAGYAHMAGRTGRSGKSGTAFTFVRPKNNEVKRLVAIAATLGVKFNQKQID